MGYVYLLHFERPYKHAKHYLGYASNVSKRLAKHRDGHGARLLQVLKAEGIGWHLVRLWPDATRTDERRLKNKGGAARVCPVCGAKHKIFTSKSKKLQEFILHV